MFLRIALQLDICTPIDDETDEEEFRTYLFQGEVLREVYGEGAYSYWSSTDPELVSEQHINIVKQVLALSKEERQGKIRRIIKQAS